MIMSVSYPIMAAGEETNMTADNGQTIELDRLLLLQNNLRPSGVHPCHANVPPNSTVIYPV